MQGQNGRKEQSHADRVAHQSWQWGYLACSPAECRIEPNSTGQQSESEPVRDLWVLIIDDVWETASTMRRVVSVPNEMEAAQIRALATTRTK